jgi:hypothetical protein
MTFLPRTLLKLATVDNTASYDPAKGMPSPVVTPGTDDPNEIVTRLPAPAPTTTTTTTPTTTATTTPTTTPTTTAPNNGAPTSAPVGNAAFAGNAGTRPNVSTWEPGNGGLAVPVGDPADFKAMSRPDLANFYKGWGGRAYTDRAPGTVGTPVQQMGSADLYSPTPGNPGGTHVSATIDPESSLRKGGDPNKRVLNSQYGTGSVTFNNPSNWATAPDRKTVIDGKTYTGPNAFRDHLEPIVAKQQEAAKTQAVAEVDKANPGYLFKGPAMADPRGPAYPDVPNLRNQTMAGSRIGDSPYQSLTDPDRVNPAIGISEGRQQYINDLGSLNLPARVPAPQQLLAGGKPGGKPGGQPAAEPYTSMPVNPQFKVPSTFDPSRNTFISSNRPGSYDPALAAMREGDPFGANVHGQPSHSGRKLTGFESDAAATKDWAANPVEPKLLKKQSNTVSPLDDPNSLLNLDTSGPLIRELPAKPASPVAAAKPASPPAVVTPKPAAPATPKVDDSLGWEAATPPPNASAPKLKPSDSGTLGWESGPMPPTQGQQDAANILRNQGNTEFRLLNNWPGSDWDHLKKQFPEVKPEQYRTTNALIDAYRAVLPPVKSGALHFALQCSKFASAIMHTPTGLEPQGGLAKPKIKMPIGPGRPQVAFEHAAPAKPSITPLTPAS